jgi:vitamin B12 transporter
MKYVFCVTLTLFLCLSGMLFAQESLEITIDEPIIVTATRVEIAAEQVGKTVTIVTAEQLEAQQATSLVDALQSIPGLLVRQQRGPGGLTAIKILGLDSEYTQILIDSLPLRDPSDPQGAAGEFMSDVMIENIERIEVVRGSSSTLYGSDSVGGTINIITKKSDTPFGAFVSFEGGSMATYQEAAGVQGMTGMLNFSLTGKRIDSDGIDDHDTYGETSLAGRVGLKLLMDASVIAQFKYTDVESDLNDSPGILDGVMVKDADDEDDSKTKTLFSGGMVLEQEVSERFDYTAKLGYVDVDREFTFGPEGDEFGFGSETTYAGNTLNAEAQANYSLNDAHLLTLGYEFESEEFEQVLGERTDTPDATRHAVYLQDSIALLSEMFNIVPGVRYMNHDQAGDRFDWEVSASYLLEDTGLRLHGHVGTGFRAPSLYELYGASIFGTMLYEFGNEDLEPEESLGWDLGIGLTAFEEMLRVDATYFSNTFDQIIDFGTVGYENVDGGESRGVEMEAALTPFDQLTVSGTYTYASTENADGEKFYGVPEHEFGANLQYQVLENLTATATLTVRGNEDIPLFDSTTFVSERYENDGFTTLDIGLKYAFSDNFTVWGRVENLVDEEYTIGGYTAPGRSLYGGIKWNLLR